MKYLKRFNEDLGFNLDTPIGYEIVYNHQNVNKIMEFLEETFGTKENPLKQYKNPEDDDDHKSSSIYYGKDNKYRGDMIFLVRDDIFKKRIIVNDKVWRRLRDLLNYDLEIKDFEKDVLMWYINMIYDDIGNIPIRPDTNSIRTLSYTNPKYFYQI